MSSLILAAVCSSSAARRVLGPVELLSVAKDYVEAVLLVCVSDVVLSTS